MVRRLKPTWRRRLTTSRSVTSIVGAYVTDALTQNELSFPRISRLTFTISHKPLLWGFSLPCQQPMLCTGMLTRHRVTRPGPIRPQVLRSRPEWAFVLATVNPLLSKPQLTGSALDGPITEHAAYFDIEDIKSRWSTYWSSDVTNLIKPTDLFSWYIHENKTYSYRIKIREGKRMSKL